jgi:hypothetical protein
MGAGADEVRAYRQPQDCQGARSCRAALTAWRADKLSNRDAVCCGACVRSWPFASFPPRCEVRSLSGHGGHGHASGWLDWSRMTPELTQLRVPRCRRWCRLLILQARERWLKCPVPLLPRNWRRGQPRRQPLCPSNSRYYLHSPSSLRVHPMSSVLSQAWRRPSGGRIGDRDHDLSMRLHPACKSALFHCRARLHGHLADRG